MSISGRSSFSCIRMISALPPSDFSRLNSGLCAAEAASADAITAYPTIFFSIFFVLISKLTVVAFFQCIIQIGGGMYLAVVFDLLIASELDLGTIFERE